MSATGLCLRRGEDRRELIDELAAVFGGRVGLNAVLDHPDRRAVPMRIPAHAADWGFRWDLPDLVTRQWWPQGITTSADASDRDDIAGRRVVVTSWYAAKRRDYSPGSRLSFVDVTDEARPTYRHVLLVQLRRDKTTGSVETGPVRVHAGGILWYGPSILVADTRGGVRVFDVDDVIGLTGRGQDGYRYVLPQRTAYKAEHDDGFTPFRFSFLSADRSGADHQLIAGEYGRDEQTRRLTRFALDPAQLTFALEGGCARPLEIVVDGQGGMQGAVMVDGTFYITTSRGRWKSGTMWVRGADGRAREHRGALTVGCEDLTYWPQRDRLWSLSEHPGRRYVYSMPRMQFTP